MRLVPPLLFLPSPASLHGCITAIPLLLGSSCYGQPSYTLFQSSAQSFSCGGNGITKNSPRRTNLPQLPSHDLVHNNNTVTKLTEVWQSLPGCLMPAQLKQLIYFARSSCCNVRCLGVSSQLGCQKFVIEASKSPVAACFVILSWKSHQDSWGFTPPQPVSPS